MTRSIGANPGTYAMPSSAAPAAARVHSGRARALLRRAGAVVWQWRARIRQRQELAELLAAPEYRLFRDLRVTRFDVLQEINKPFWRP